MIAYLCRTCDHESLHDETVDDIARDRDAVGFCVECPDCKAALRADIARNVERTGHVSPEIWKS